VRAQLRDPIEADAPALADLLQQHARANFGEVGLSEDEVRSWLRLPNLWIQVAERDGELVGYVDVGIDENRFDIDARTLEPEVAKLMVDAAEAEARRRSDHPRLRGFAQGDDAAARAVFVGNDGWRAIRHSFQMQIDFDGELPEPEWPKGLTLRNLREGEEERVWEAANDAFADHWDFHPRPFDEWIAFHKEPHRFDPSLWWLVEDGDELAAVSINSWHASGDPTFGWVHVLGTRPPWRRRGLATALLLHSFRDFRVRGATRVGLGVDGENTTGAVRLYESVGMHVARRNDIYERTA
jgi:mycothiol synthase